MGTSRKIPQSITGRLNAMTIAQTKKDAPAPAVNILSDATSARLDLDLAAYQAGKDNIVTTKAVYHAAIESAIPQRVSLKTFVTSFYNSVNNAIKMKTILPSARAYYDLNISNRQMPDMRTDASLLVAANRVLSGDILRRAAGGIAIASPTIAQFTTILNTAKPVISAISNARTLVNAAIAALKAQVPEIKDLITHVWNEVEDYYSLSTPANRRTDGRLWGIRYQSTGVLSVVTGTVKDELGVAIAGAKVRIIGSKIYTLTDALGNFSLNTTLYDALEMAVTHINYENNITDFTKEDGVPMAVAVVMTHTI